MTLLGRLLSLFPLFNSSLVLAALIWFLINPGLLPLLSLVFSAYAFPLICFHIHQHYFPLKEGLSDITKGYSPWYGSHRIQGLYFSFPVFERILRMIPGAFSVWLRLWGSKIGKNVYWTPRFELLDRHLLEVGDNCVIGYNVTITGHIIRPSSRYGLVVYVKKVRIKNDVLVGAAVQIGPGVTLEEKSQVAATCTLFPNTVLGGKITPQRLAAGQTGQGTTS